MFEEKVDEVHDIMEEILRGRATSGDELHGDVRREPNGVLDVQTLRAQIVVVSVDLGFVEDGGKEGHVQPQGFPSQSLVLHQDSVW